MPVLARRAAPVAALLMVAGCAPPAAPDTPSGPTSDAGSASTATATATAGGGFGDGFGASVGATEVSEPALGLVVVDESGAVMSIDLTTGASAELGTVPAPSAVSTDGRFVFAAGEPGVTVVDGGAWTVPHGDHSHYYTLTPRVVGLLPGSASTTRIASGTSAVTAFSPSDGVGRILDASALGDGDISVTGEISAPAHDGVLVPIADAFVRTVPDASGTAQAVEVVDATGAVRPGTSTPCPQAAGTITSRVGVVIGCADGAVLVTAGAGATGGSSDEGTGEPTADEVTLERIAYPQAVATDDRARQFRARRDRPTVAAVAGNQGAWLLNTRARSWSLLTTATPLVAVTAVDDRTASVVAVDRSGRVVVLDGDSGEQTGHTEPLLAQTLSDPTLAAGVTIEVDAHRAYVNDPAGSRVLEIDYRDGARVARELAVPVRPRFLAEVGR